MSIRQLYSGLRAHLTRWFRRSRPPFVYVALGDSTVEGVGASHHTKSYAHLVYADLERHYGPVTYLNLGKRGARVSDVVDNQLAAAVSAKPRLVTISIGANDVVRRTSLRVFRASLQALLGTLRHQTGAIIVMTNIPDFSFTKRIPSSLKPVVRLRIRQYNAVIKRVAKEFDVVLVDTFRESAATASRFPDTLSGDNFHPSDTGYLLWANIMLTVIHQQLRSSRRRLVRTARGSTQSSAG